MIYTRWYLFVLTTIIATNLIGQNDDGTNTSTSAEGYKIGINVNNYDNDTLLVGYYLGNKTLAKDTLISNQPGVFVYEGMEALAPGVYMLLKRPDNSFVQFFINDDDQEFDINWDVETSIHSFNGSEDNELFMDYVDFLEKQREILNDLNNEKERVVDSGGDTLAIESQIDQLDQSVKDRQRDIIQEFPKTITALFLKSSQNTPMPEFQGTDEEIQQKQYEFYRKHYFDYLELDNPASLHTPFFDERIMNYLDRVTYQIPDSIILEIDHLLSQMEAAPETYRYYLSTFLNTYANKKIIGMDAVYVHLVDNYYLKGKAPWIEDDILEEIVKTSNAIKATLIGKTFPSIVTYTAENEPVDINALDADYKIVIFWSHTCPHCKKSMPDVVAFQKEYDDKNVKTITVCTKAREKADDCMAYVAENDMKNLINTFDPRQLFRRKIEVRTTPKIFILDRDNEILLKDLGPDKLSIVMPQIMEMTKTKSK